MKVLSGIEYGSMFYNMNSVKIAHKSYVISWRETNEGQ